MLFLNNIKITLFHCHCHNVSWRCAQYFVIASCGQMPRDNRCMYIAHVCFFVGCSDCVGGCGNVCCVAAVVCLFGGFVPYW